jgi:hypothetical protein
LPQLSTRPRLIKASSEICADEPVRVEFEPSRACVEPSSSLSLSSVSSQARIELKTRDLIELNLEVAGSFELGSLTAVGMRSVGPM